MTAFVALLRAVNVGGRGKIAMADLKTLARDEGLQTPATLLQSGNLVFETDDRKQPDLERLLQRALSQKFGLDTDVVVRTAEVWVRLIEANPFPKLAVDDPSHLVLMPLKTAARQGAEAALRDAIAGREEVAVRGDAAHIAYRDGIGRSKLTMSILERHLGVRGTGRNWNTVLKIAAALAR